MTKFGERVLVTYSLLASLALVIVFLEGATSSKVQTFEEIRVHRIDVVEPDGTLRMVISNRDRLPGVIVKGKELPKSGRPGAGMLFYNDEGSENGGLVFAGHRMRRVGRRTTFVYPQAGDSGSSSLRPRPLCLTSAVIR